MEKLYLDFHAAPAYPRTALCLSGGGIRSATFGLGVIQFLAQTGLLSRFEYLSTVSGGGYIGSWLSTWFTRLGGGNIQGAYETIRERLAGRTYPEKEAEEIERLRANSNYLTPKLGALSADTWTAVAIWFRNLIINWFLLIPLIAAAAVAPQLISALMGAAEGSSWAMAVQIIGICFYAVGLVVFNGARPRWQAFNLNQRNFLIFSLLPLIISAVLWAITMAHASALTSLWRSFIPAQIGPLSLPIPDYIFLAAVLYLVATAVSWVWNKYYAPPYIRRTITSSEARLLRYSFSLTRAAAAGASVVVYTEDHQAAAGKHYLTASNEIVFPPGQIESRNKFDIELTGEPIGKEPVKDGDVFIKFRDPHELRIGGVFGSARASDVLAFVFSGACFGLFVGAGDLLLRPPSGQAVSAWHHLGISAFAVPWLLLSHALATVIFVALTSWLPRSDEEREWIGRAAGWVLVIALLWTGIAALVLLLPKAISDILTYYGIGFSTIDTRKVAALVVSAFGGISGIFTAVVGGGPKTAAIPGQHQSNWRKLALYVGAPIFLASLFIGLSLAIDWLAFGESFSNHIGEPNTNFWQIVGGLLFWGYTPALVAVIAGLCININRFSLHEIYRNRLVRAFLGASNLDKAGRNLFTFFNFTDNLPMSRLWTRRKEEPPSRSPKPCEPESWRPFHVVNIALNLVATENLAWQQRKAEAFTVSPLWCGAAQLDAYRRTSEYGGKKDTITVGTAMAISGAAVSPNMGYNSSPLITFLLTLFNVRLGWWLGNPKYDRFADEGPRWAAAPLLFELFGLTDSRRKYVYLSDGGHFENLGLYEMVRRRCHMIIVSDAGHDPELAFADLANAVRKIWIDLGVRIEFPKLDELRTRNKGRDDPTKGGPCYTVGCIRYKDADKAPSNSSDQVKDGTILYLKPGFRGDETADIVGYAAGSTEFPHEPTIDQWFSESQFESYRGLGFSIIKRAHDKAVKNHNKKVGNQPIQDFSGAPLLSFFESLSMSCEGEPDT